jgi:hypothetical protein
MFQKAKGNLVMVVGVFAILCIFSFSVFGQRATAPIFSFGGGFSFVVSSNYIQHNRGKRKEKICGTT